MLQSVSVNGRRRGGWGWGGRGEGEGGGEGERWGGVKMWMGRGYAYWCGILICTIS